MANTKQEIFIPRTGDVNDAGLYVSVNGEAYLLPRGRDPDTRRTGANAHRLPPRQAFPRGRGKVSAKLTDEGPDAPG